MERLTQWIDENRAIPRVDLRRCGHERCTTQLARYEDTGLTPEQIQEMDRLYTEKCREVAKLRQRDKAVLPENIKGNKKNNGRLRFGTCPKCKARVTNVESGNYCQNCGQRLKWGCLEDRK